MGQVTVIFVRGQDNLIDNVIAKASGGPFVHVAIMVPDVGLVESLGMGGPGIIPPCVRISSLRKYDNANVEKFDVDLSDLPAAQAKAEELIGTEYGFDNLVAGGLFDLFGIEVPDLLRCADCSRTVALILHEGGKDILPGVPTGSITPMDEERELKRVD